MGMVMMASGLTLTMLLEVMGEETTMEDGLTMEVAGWSRMTGLEAAEVMEVEEVVITWFNL